ncbi:putative membrane protein [Orientia tsutsugamushi str. Sido]|nr:putative membrane protein [Orientia tsutsugamushi str. Sido]
MLKIKNLLPYYLFGTVMQFKFTVFISHIMSYDMY